jgi:hypothetical protein
MIFINTVNDTPTTPTLHTPLYNSEITTLYTELVVNNATDPENELIHYIFELDTVNTFDGTHKRSPDPISETPDTTGWPVNELLDNTWYYWRTKASDGLGESSWMNGRFFVNQFNDAPGTPKALNPGDNSWVGNLQPTLEVYPVVDIDGDTLSYEFEIYQANKHGESFERIMTGSSNTTNWQLDQQLGESGNYYWHARAIDEHGLAGEWGELVMFFADSDGINDKPDIKLKHLKYKHGDVLAIHKYENEHRNNIQDGESFVEIKWKDNDPDSNAIISLYFDTDRSGEDGLLITQNILEDPDGQLDSYLWDISMMSPGVYYVYAVIDDGFSTTIDYSRNAVVIGNGGGLPFLLFNAPGVSNEGKRNQLAKIEWRDLDYNSNASISFYFDADNTGFDGSLIVSDLEEDLDGKDDKYMWNVSAIPDGEYFIYAIISDGVDTYRVYAEEPFTIRHGNNGN